MKKRIQSTMMLVAMLFPSLCQAWGDRGHFLVCNIAVSFIQEKGLRDYLVGKGQMLGTVCNAPDSHWKRLAQSSKIADASHHVHPEILQKTKFDDIPLSFAELATLEGQDPLKFAVSFGTAWWRADQFHRRSVKSFKEIRISSKPTNTQEQYDANLPYNKAVYNFIVNFGLLGHYIGDLTQPYHNVKDYDGWDHGRGGIHAFYESIVINYFSHNFENEIYLKALSEMKDENKGSCDQKHFTFCELKKLSLLALKELPLLEEKDKLIEPSNKLEKKRAVRKSPEIAGEAFKELITTELARSALTLARFWDKAYRDSGKPELPNYFPPQYPVAPEFIDLDYVK